MFGNRRAWQNTITAQGYYNNTDTHYIQIHSSLSLQTGFQKHSHIQYTHRSILLLKSNSWLHAPPPDLHPSVSFLPKEDRVYLARLRCRHHPATLRYQKRLDGANVLQMSVQDAAQHPTLLNTLWKTKLHTTTLLNKTTYIL